ncbi:MAG TPA: iron-sulfur cluster assembly scaffold protein [Planctomycetota bacterium]|nr:iron-sulfur cluster assembly scaffold protein [Planctomycetota bacterium]
MSFYSDKVLEHFSHPRNVGPIPAADGVGQVGDVSCGDVFKVWIRVRDGRIAKASFQVMGCPSAIAAASMMTELAAGRTPEEALRLSDADVAAALGGMPEERLHCSNHAAAALHAAAEDYVRSRASLGGGEPTLLDRLRLRLRTACAARGLLDGPVTVTARALTPEQAIGNPEHDDYPVIKGRERMIEAEFLGARGHAFTDRPGGFSGTLAEILDMPLANNYRRAVFVAAANAVARHLGAAERTVHCRDEDLTRCAALLPDFVAANHPDARRIFLVGLQPRFAEALAPRFELRIADLDAENVGRKKGGVAVEPAGAAAGCLAWCDLILATGSTVANGSADALLAAGKPAVFYGVSGSGAAALLDLPRFCPCGQ